jgi:hypothetical protein
LETKSVSQGAGAAGHRRGDHAFCGDARRGLAGLVAELDAQDLFSAGGIAISLGQCLLALHHRGVGLGAQFGHHACGDCGHWRISVQTIKRPMPPRRGGGSTGHVRGHPGRVS